jgi:TatD DNase family protein
LTAKEYDQDLEAVLARMKEYGVGTITVGVDRATSEEAITFAEANENFYATVGLHPCDSPSEEFRVERFESLVKHPRVVAIGECGLDYYYTQDPKEKERQRREFEAQIQFAIEHLKPLMLHCRSEKGTVDAYEDALAMLEPVRGKVSGNVHFFTGTIDIARRFYDLNFSTSFNGVLTFAREYDEVVRFAPIDMLLTETDSPYAAPVPYRGKRNEPSYVRHVVTALATITGLPEDKLAEQVVANALRVFAIGPLA